MDIVSIPFLIALVIGPVQGPPPPPPPPTNPFTAARDAVPDRKGTAVIRGHVFTAEGRPLRRAQIRVTGGDLRTPPTASTGLEGEFEIRELPSGRFTIHVSRSGYISLQYGQAAPGEPGEPLDVKDGTVVDKLKITMTRAAVISGRLTDETGEPAAGVDMWVMQEQFFRGKKQLGPVVDASAHFTTDETGQYRLTGLSPGEYLVMANTRETWMSDEKQPQMLSYAPTYFPGTANPGEARRVKIAGGQETPAIDFALTAVRAARLSGTATGLDGAPMAGSVALMHEMVGATGGRISMTGNARIGQDGTWRLTDVPPGDYTLRAVDGSTGDTASLSVSVIGEHIDGLQLTAAASGLLSGRVVTELGEPLPAARLTVAATPATMFGTSPRTTPGKDDGVVGKDGTFTRRTSSGEVIPRLTGLPRGWWLKSVLAGGRDYEGVPINLPPGSELADVSFVISNRFPSVSGGVTDADGRAARASVVLFSVDPARWPEAAANQKLTRTDANGQYRFDGVRPGEYFVIAVNSVPRWQINDPDALREYQKRASRITVGETDLTADLKVGR